MVYSWGFAIQQEIAPNTAVEIGYQGSHGLHDYVVSNANDARPGPGTLQSRRPFAQYQNINYIFGRGDTSFNGLEVKLERRPGSSGLSMLVAYSWCKSLDKIIFLGTPHLGAPLERGGHWIDILLGAMSYASPFAKLGKVRSAGITDLRHGSLLDDDWQGQDRFETGVEALTPVPLPTSVRCYTIAATIDDGSKTRSVSATGKRLLGDGLVPLNSALGKHKDATRHLNFPQARQCVLHGMNHMELLKAAAVYPVLKAFVDA